METKIYTNYNEKFQPEISLIREKLKHSFPSNPALARVQAKLNASSAVETVITSYDRMHHRHNRS